MIHQFFKQVQDAYGVKSKDLAEIVGISAKHISEFRSGKANISVDLLWQLVEAMDKLSPGAKKEFGFKLSGGWRVEMLNQHKDWHSVISDATPDDLEEIFLAMADRWSQMKSKKKDKKYKKAEREDLAISA